MEGNSPENINPTDDQKNVAAINNAETAGELASNNNKIAGMDINQNYNPQSPQAIPMSEVAPPSQNQQAIPMSEVTAQQPPQPDDPSRREFLIKAAVGTVAAATGVAAVSELSQPRNKNGTPEPGPIARFFSRLFKRNESTPPTPPQTPDNNTPQNNNPSSETANQLQTEQNPTQPVK